jgi:hypothetical protein
MISCYPDDLVVWVPERAWAGVAAVGCSLADPTTAEPIHVELNGAWDRFWGDPSGFAGWEKGAVARLMP